MNTLQYGCILVVVARIASFVFNLAEMTVQDICLVFDRGMVQKLPTSENGA